VPEDRQKTFRPVTVLHIGGGHHYREDQSEGVHKDVTLTPFDLLARIVPADPPFSVVLTG
jgi:hypothetical protein